MDDLLQNEVLSLDKAGVTKPLLFIIRPSYRCNSRCIMCDFWKKTDSGLTFEKIKNAVIDAKELGTKEIRLTGGEPTIYPYFFETMMLTKDLGMDFSFITNGFTLSREIINRVLMYSPKQIHVSIDSSRAETHNRIRGIKSFEKIIGNLEFLKKKSPNQKVIVNYVVNNLNYEHIHELMDEYGGKLFDELNLIPIRGNKNLFLNETQVKDYNDRIVPMIKKMASKTNTKLRHENPFVFGEPADMENTLAGNYTKNFYKNIDCTVSKYTLFLDATGAVYPCANTPYKGDKFLLGNIFTHSVKHIWESKNRKEKMKNAGKPGICDSCDPINCQANKFLSRVDY